MIPLVYKGILLKNAMGFNRTFMELKHSTHNYEVVRAACFNRTFMELKQGGGGRAAQRGAVLIGPSWN